MYGLQSAQLCVQICFVCRREADGSSRRWINNREVSDTNRLDIRWTKQRRHHHISELSITRFSGHHRTSPTTAAPRGLHAVTPLRRRGTDDAWRQGHGLLASTRGWSGLDQASHLYTSSRQTSAGHTTSASLSALELISLTYRNVWPHPGRPQGVGLPWQPQQWKREPDRSSSFQESKKCAYHVTFDLDLDLEHILDARGPEIHRVQVWWRSGHLSARRSDLPKSLQTDRRTDDGRRAIALSHSWNELRTNGVLLRNRQIHNEFTFIPSSENITNSSSESTVVSGVRCSARLWRK